MASAKQKAAARRNIRKAQAALRKKRPGKKRRAARSAPTARPRKRSKTNMQKTRRFRSKGQGFVDTDGLMWGTAGGFLANVGGNFLGPTVGTPAGLILAGAMAADNATRNTLDTIAGIAFGSRVGGNIGLPFTGSPNGNGGVGVL